jgi:threonylcarbamoyladenosine tRNA methylthiotransferase MtaB
LFINNAIKNPKTELIVICGCYSQVNRIDNDKIGIILGNKYKNDIVNLITQYKKNQIIKVDDISHENKLEEVSNTFSNNTTRSYIKIQDGCN